MSNLGITIEGLDLVDVIRFIKKKKNRFLAILLLDIEETLKHDPETYAIIRKLVLDAFNDFSRSLMRIFFGDDVEGFIMK